MIIHGPVETNNLFRYNMRMIIIHEVLGPALAERNPPRPCPMLDRETNNSFFSHGFDTDGGYNETPDGKGVTCTPVCHARNPSIIHPSCQVCNVVGKVIFDMEEYRKKIGL